MGLLASGRENFHFAALRIAEDAAASETLREAPVDAIERWPR
jgi:hypothetical protein